MAQIYRIGSDGDPLEGSPALDPNEWMSVLEGADNYR